MPSALRSRTALFALLGAFLIPLGISSMKGLTHILTCQEDAKTPFTITIPGTGLPEISSSTRIQPGERGLCGGLALDMRAGPLSPGRVRMIIAIRNNSDLPWRGTVNLVLEGSSPIPIDIGEIGPGRTGSDEIPLRLPTGSHQVDGSLLIGP